MDLPLLILDSLQFRLCCLFDNLKIHSRRHKVRKFLDVTLKMTFVEPICWALLSCKIVVQNLVSVRLHVVFSTYCAETGEDLVVNALNKHYLLKRVESVRFRRL
jgi:hypothetical protein